MSLNGNMIYCGAAGVSYAELDTTTEQEGLAAKVEGSDITKEDQKSVSSAASSGPLCPHSSLLSLQGVSITCGGFLFIQRPPAIAKDVRIPCTLFQPIQQCFWDLLLYVSQFEILRTIFHASARVVPC